MATVKVFVASNKEKWWQSLDNLLQLREMAMSYSLR
jgi:hypothetical protein